MVKTSMKRSEEVPQCSCHQIQNTKFSLTRIKPAPEILSEPNLRMKFHNIKSQYIFRGASVEPFLVCHWSDFHHRWRQNLSKYFQSVDKTQLQNYCIFIKWCYTNKKTCFLLLCHVNVLFTFYICTFSRLMKPHLLIHTWFSLSSTTMSLHSPPLASVHLCIWQFILRNEDKIIIGNSGLNTVTHFFKTNWILLLDVKSFHLEADVYRGFCFFVIKNWIIVQYR